MTVTVISSKGSPAAVSGTAMPADIPGKTDRIEGVYPDRNSQLRVTPIRT
jgi:hypothetical protein